jgi:hypothetical protein
MKNTYKDIILGWGIVAAFCGGVFALDLAVPANTNKTPPEDQIITLHDIYADNLEHHINNRRIRIGEFIANQGVSSTHNPCISVERMNNIDRQKLAEIFDNRSNKEKSLAGYMQTVRSDRINEMDHYEWRITGQALVGFHQQINMVSAAANQCRLMIELAGR